MILKLLLFVSILSYSVLARDLCRPFYSKIGPSISINNNSKNYQEFKADGFQYKLINLKELKTTDPLYSVVFDYLNKQYPNSLKARHGEDFVNQIQQSNKALWDQMHLMLMFDEKNPNQIAAGVALISARLPSEYLGFEAELGIRQLPREQDKFKAATEIGRLRVDHSVTERRDVIDQLFKTLFQVLNNSTEFSDVYFFTAKTLKKLYQRMGYEFIDVPELENRPEVRATDIISKLKY